MLTPALDHLHRLAQEICHDIRDLRPELVIGLAHSGWLPLHAARFYWEATRTRAFPPVLRINLGLEKVHLYHSHFVNDEHMFCCDEFMCSSDLQRGHLIAWVGRQAAWIEALRRQAVGVLGLNSTPRTILIVDDLHSSGSTALLAQAAAYWAFPDSAVHLIAGCLDWTNSFTTAWLAEFVPDLYQEIWCRETKPEYNFRYPDARYPVLKALLTGTEDGEPGTLGWKPVGADSPAVRLVEPYISGEAALKASAWVQDKVEDFLLDRLTNPEAAVQGPLTHSDCDIFPWRGRLTPRIKCLAAAWHPEGLGWEQVARFYAVPEDQARELVKSLASEEYLEARPANSREVRYYGGRKGA